MITSKQRAYLRGLANTIDPIFQLGKGGLDRNFYIQVSQALEAREIIKITVLENALLDTRAAANDIAEEVSAEIVQVIGSKIVLYKESEKNKRIVL